MSEIWLDGAFVPSEGAIAADDRGFLLSDGLFDTALAIGGKVFLRELHLARFVSSADILSIPVERASVETAMDALAERQKNGSLRLSLSRGSGPRGLVPPSDPEPRLMGSSAPLNVSQMFDPVHIDVSSIRRNETSPTSRMKSLAYLDSVIANEAARQAGAREALFLNTKDRLACTAMANIFLLVDNELLTPPLLDGAVDGTVRRWVIENAEAFGLQPRDRPLHLDDIASGTLFMTNSLRLIAPCWLTPAGEGRYDPRLRELMSALCEAIAGECGTDPRELGAVIPSF